jgi:HlyD family secretion protein
MNIGKLAGGFITLGLVLVAIALWLRPASVEVDLAEVSYGVFERTVDDEGKTRVRDRYVVSAPVSGRLMRPELRVGDFLKVGQKLFLLYPQDPALIDRRTASALQARALAAGAALERADMELARTRTAEQLARSEALRATDLAKRGFTSEASRETAALTLAEREQARLAADRARAVAAFELNAAVAALQATTASAIPRNEEIWTIAAPVSGRVLRIPQESEVVVAMGSALIEIGDTEALEVVMEALSTDAGAIRPGNVVRMSMGATHPEVTGTVRRIEPVARTKISALGIEEQRVSVVIDLPGALDPPPGDGWRVDVSIVTETHQSVLVIPVGALLRDRSGWSVYVAAAARAELRPVDLGGRNAQRAWIRSGLASGEKVVVHPPDALQDGASIVPRKERSRH